MVFVYFYLIIAASITIQKQLSQLRRCLNKSSAVVAAAAVTSEETLQQLSKQQHAQVEFQYGDEWDPTVDERWV